MKQGIIFDMDGTLWDSTVGVAVSWNEILKQEKVNRTPLTVEDFRGIMGKTMDVIAAKFFPDMPEKERMELLDKCGEYENEYLSGHGAVLYPGVEETFAKLKEKYELYIVSNCQSGYIEAFLSYYKLGKYISDIECYGNNEKQKEDNIALVVSRNALTDAVYVGDIQSDYESSKKAGVAFIHAAYGFGTIDDEVPEIENLSQLPEVVEKVFAGK